MKTLLILFLIFASFLKGADTMKTVDSVDLEKFMGKWFVIALVPNMIEKGATNSSDTYVLNKDGTIDITYDAIKDGQARQIKQKGTVIDKTSNAEWTIQMRKPFIPFMKFPFKIVYIDDSYEYMAVGYPKNTMGWIMGRTSKITDEEYNKIMKGWKKNRSVSIKSSAYDTYFGLSTSALASDDEFEVKEDATKAEIKRAFGKSLKSKKMNKKILSEFIELVA